MGEGNVGESPSNRFPLRIKIRSSDDVLSAHELRDIKRGNVFHYAISYLTHLPEDLELLSYAVRDVILRALGFLGEKHDIWDIENEFVEPLMKVLVLPEVEEVFSHSVDRVFIERSILLKKEKDFSILRPDRVVILPDRVIVTDFKTRYGSAEAGIKYINQVLDYAKLFKLMYPYLVIGRIVYILDTRVEEQVLE